MANEFIDVPLGPATVEYYDGETENDPTIFDITKGGVVFSANFTKQDVTVDQYGDTVVKSIFKGGSCQAVIPFALHDLDKLNSAFPNSKLTTDATDPKKKKIEVFSKAGYNMTKNGKKLVIKPIDPEATPNDWITIPIATPLTNLEQTYNSDNERVYQITMGGYPDISKDGLLFIMGDETATEATGS